MADPTFRPPVTEMNDIFLQGITCPYQLSVAESKMTEAGFGLLALEKIPAGKEIFRAKPVVSVVASFVNACDSCFGCENSRDPFKPPVNLLTCASCKRVKYCSKGCQRTAWKNYHKKECTIYGEIDTQILQSKSDSQAIRMLIRSVILHQHGTITATQWKAISALISHHELRWQSEELDLPQIDADIRLVKQVTECDMSESDLQDLYWQIEFNKHSIGSPLQPQLGSSLIPSASMINHSCNPNAHHFSEGSELIVRSTRNIAKNEEITISYIDPTKSFEERQKLLSTMYAFGCQCRKCMKGFQDQGEVLTGNSVLDEPIRDAKHKLYALLEALANGTQQLDDVETKMRAICNESSSGKPWPINASPLPDLYQVLARKFEFEQRWENAVRIWLKVVYVIDPLHYPERLNMHRVENLMELCQLISRISQFSEIDVEVKNSFRSIETAMASVQNRQYIQLKEDAAASLGTNHVIFKAAAHFIEVLDKQRMAAMGVPYSVLVKKETNGTIEGNHESIERELLNWAHIDLTTKTI